MIRHALTKRIHIHEANVAFPNKRRKDQRKLHHNEATFHTLRKVVHCKKFYLVLLSMPYSSLVKLLLIGIFPYTSIKSSEEVMPVEPMIAQ